MISFHVTGINSGRLDKRLLLLVEKPTYGSAKLIEEGTYRGILPDVLCLEPLQAWVYADGLYLHWLFYTKLCRKGFQRVLPEGIFLLLSSQSESDFVDGIIRSH